MKNVLILRHIFYMNNDKMQIKMLAVLFALYIWKGMYVFSKVLAKNIFCFVDSTTTSWNDSVLKCIWYGTTILFPSLMATHGCSSSGSHISANDEQHQIFIINVYIDIVEQM